MNRQAIGRRSLKRHGYDITWIQYTKTGEDDHGDAQYDDTEQTITGYVQFNSVNAPDVSLDASGEDFTVDVQIFVSDEHDITPMARGERPDRFVIDNVMYEVVEAQIQHNGIIACVGSRG